MGLEATFRFFYIMSYTQDISCCLAEQIGDSGLEDKDIVFLLDRLRPILEALLRNAHAINDFSVLDTPNIDDLSSLTTLSRKWREKFETVWILGAGGSSLGGKMLYELSEKKANPSESSPRFAFLRISIHLRFRKRSKIVTLIKPVY